MLAILMECPEAPTVRLEQEARLKERQPAQDLDPVRYVERHSSTPLTLLIQSGQQPHPLSQVYSFVPIPGAQQHKRPRRRYEEIERMYKCGWQGCEKAYGTLNHLNAHVTMQSHGQKRTPEGQFPKIQLFVANALFGLACAYSSFGYFAATSPVTPKGAFIVGGGTMLHVALRSPYSKSLGPA